jgi:hypothetical protein
MAKPMTPERAAYIARHHAKIAAAYRKPKPPADSWWANRYETRAAFYVKAEQEYHARLVGFGISDANTF